MIRPSSRYACFQPTDFKMFTAVIPRRIIRKKPKQHRTILLPTTAKPSTPPPSLDNVSTDLELQPSPSPGTLDGSQQHDTHKPLINPRLLSDATIGLSDGLTVPFALTAGLTALGDTRTVIYGGLAELIAGAISMGLGGYLGARGELAAYEESHARLLVTLLQEQPPGEPTNKAATTTGQQDTVIEALQRGLFPLRVPAEILQQQLVDGEKEEWVGLLLRLQGISLPSTSPEETTTASDDESGECKRRKKQRRDDSRIRAMKSAITIAAGYFLGGLLPLIPYFFVAGHMGKLMTGLYISIGVMGVALFTFGYVKTGVVVGFGRQHSKRCVLGGVQMVVVGGMAAGAAMGLVKGFEGVGTFGP